MNKLSKLYANLEGTSGIAREIILQQIAELEAEIEKRQQSSKSDNKHEAREYPDFWVKKKVVRIDK